MTTVDLKKRLGLGNDGGGERGEKCLDQAANAISQGITELGRNISHFFSFFTDLFI